MRLIVMYKNEMMNCVEDVEQAHFFEDKVIMNKLPLNITELKLEKVSSINCQDISIEKLKQVKDQLALTEKALELACLVISKAMCPNGDWESLKIDFANAYKEQAKEMMKSE